ncbi:hypothetical protein ES702_00515 [subsurface metagenome]
MAEYSKKTVADLQEILKSRGLASSGKKADLIARLTEADKAAESKGKQNTLLHDFMACASRVSAQTTSHLIPSYSCAFTLTVVAEAEPEPQHEPAVEEPAPADPVEPTPEVPQDAGPSGNQADGQVAEQSGDADPAAATAEEKNFALNLAASDIDKEMEKRKARAERFKTGGQANADAELTETATADTDALKNLERAKRFGTGQTAIGMLDSALSSERERGPRGKKRTAGPVEESAVMDDPGLKQNFNRRGRHGRDKRRNGPPGAKPTGITKPAVANDKDRQAAEARKKRFASGS